MKELIELTEQAKEGLESPLRVYIELKKVIDELTTLQESIKREAITEANLQDENQFEFHGAKVRYVESAGSRWDFSMIEEWSATKDQLKVIEDKHKAAYQVWKRGSQYIDENGEVIAPAAYKEGNPTISISIPKK